ncbi:MAG: threonylcarbamoyl-AMP synthase [SAR324 cluster bacterium]|nr:threonylcarbamoyl-AMP synthase [SAR324 cluster bacterium]
MKIIHYPFSLKDKETLITAIQQNHVIVFPTETFYAIGGNALSEQVAARVYQIKQRSDRKPLLTLISAKWLPVLSGPLTEPTSQLMEHFWPGPLTLILPSAPQAPFFLKEKTSQGIALRYSPSPVVQEMIQLSERPLIGTSANLSGQPECMTVDGVLAQLGNLPDLIVDGGTTPGGKASTLVNCLSFPFSIEREGVLPVALLQPYLFTDV